MTEQEHAEAHRTLGEESVKTALRFENGQKEISSMRADITKLQTTIEPKPVNWPYVVFSSIGVLVVLFAAWFALGAKFSERPTRSEVDKQIQALVDGQSKLTDSQTQQQRLLDKLVEKQENSEKVMTDIRQDVRTLLNRR